MPHPTQSSSEMTGFPSSPLTMVSSPALTLGQNLMHSIEQFFGLHLSFISTAIRMVTAWEDKRTLKGFLFGLVICVLGLMMLKRGYLFIDGCYLESCI